MVLTKVTNLFAKLRAAALIACIIALTGQTAVLYGQSIEGLTAIEKRIANFEAMNLEHRLTVIESDVASLTKLAMFIAAGTATLAGEALIRVFKQAHRDPE